MTAPPAVRMCGPTRAGFVWTAGRWDWRDGAWTWQPGKWQRAPKGKHWRGGQWQSVGGSWTWSGAGGATSGVDGGWQ